MPDLFVIDIKQRIRGLKQGWEFNFSGIIVIQLQKNANVAASVASLLTG